MIDLLQSVKVPVGPINTVEEALTSDQAQARQTVVSIAADDLENGALRVLANPLKFSRTPVVYDRAPPRFGQDTETVLARAKRDDG